MVDVQQPELNDLTLGPASKDTLDGLIMKGLDIIEEILDQQRKLELSLREGFLLMSKARYSMGTKSVGVLQLPTEEGRKIEALVRVEHRQLKEPKEAAEGEDYFDFFIIPRDNSMEDGTDGGTGSNSNNGDGLRKRTTNKASFLPTSNGGKYNSSAAQPSTMTKTKSDPLNWFGVLVPQALRSSQQIFQDNVHAVCRLASLRSHLEAIRKEYAKLSKELLNTNIENLQIK